MEDLQDILFKFGCSDEQMAALGQQIGHGGKCCDSLLQAGKRRWAVQHLKEMVSWVGQDFCSQGEDTYVIQDAQLQAVAILDTLSSKPLEVHLMLEDDKFDITLAAIALLSAKSVMGVVIGISIPGVSPQDMSHHEQAVMEALKWQMPQSVASWICMFKVRFQIAARMPVQRVAPLLNDYVASLTKLVMTDDLFAELAPRRVASMIFMVSYMQLGCAGVGISPTELQWVLGDETDVSTYVRDFLRIVEKAVSESDSLRA